MCHYLLNNFKNHSYFANCCGIREIKHRMCPNGKIINFTVVIINFTVILDFIVLFIRERIRNGKQTQKNLMVNKKKYCFSKGPCNQKMGFIYL